MSDNFIVVLLQSTIFFCEDTHKIKTLYVSFVSASPQVLQGPLDGEVHFPCSTTLGEENKVNLQV